MSEKKEYIEVSAIIHSLDGEYDKVKILDDKDPVNMVVLYKDVVCTALRNSFNGQIYVDDKYGILKDYKYQREEEFYWFDPVTRGESGTYKTIEECKEAAMKYIEEDINIYERQRDEKDNDGCMFVDIMVARFNMDGDIEKTEYKDNVDLKKMYDDMTYREKVQYRVKKEFGEFKSDMLSKGTREVFYENYKIRYFDEISNFILEDNDKSAPMLSEIEYRALNNEITILEATYDEFLSNEYVSINNYGETESMLREYIIKFFGKEIDGYNEEIAEKKFVEYLIEHNIDDDYDENQRDIIKNALFCELDITHLIDNNLDYTQMLEIKDGLELGLDVSKYAKVHIPPYEMYRQRMEIRYGNRPYLCLKVEDIMIVNNNHNSVDILTSMPKKSKYCDYAVYIGKREMHDVEEVVEGKHYKVFVVQADERYKLFNGYKSVILTASELEKELVIDREKDYEKER